MSGKEEIVQLMQEDDEFEEFPEEEWADEENEKSNENELWDDNWEEEDVEDDFSIRLKKELQG
eukprot:m.3203 g.3203  ORF g.3203 m.3203 type:complete len:63 (+) comp2030_c0_seq1:55-243(+)